MAEVSEYKNIDEMWELVEKYSPNDYITSAVVTQIWFESHCVSNIVGGGYLTNYNGIEDYDKFITELIDDGIDDGSTREAFISHVIDGYQVWGYGLIQWVDPTECGKLYDYVSECGTSIGDAQTQIAFIFYNMKENFPDIWEKLLNAESAGDAGIIFSHWIGGTSDGLKLSDRIWKSEQLYEQYGKDESND